MVLAESLRAARRRADRCCRYASKLRWGAGDGAAGGGRDGGDKAEDAEEDELEGRTASALGALMPNVGWHRFVRCRASRAGSETEADEIVVDAEREVQKVDVESVRLSARLGLVL